MADYKQMYLTLLDATEKAINELVSAQRACEELYILSSEEEDRETKAKNIKMKKGWALLILFYAKGFLSCVIFFIFGYVKRIFHYAGVFRGAYKSHLNTVDLNLITRVCNFIVFNGGTAFSALMGKG